MKKNLLYIAMLAISSLSFSSCDSELDIAKHGNLGSMEDFYTNDENTMQATSQCRNGETQRVHLRHRPRHDPGTLLWSLWCHLQS